MQELSQGPNHDNMKYSDNNLSNTRAVRALRPRIKYLFYNQKQKIFSMEVEK